MPAWPCRNFYCTSFDEMCGEQHVCTRLADHDGDHYDAVTERRWHNTGRQEPIQREKEALAAIMDGTKAGSHMCGRAEP